ncbi:MAG: class I SAM-dependent methyltransferase, partial [Rhodospirillaceae bacterium]|nr:class I SAM-dependent methyltransferase [Rhodospirillaceae bacterium]
LQPHEAGDERVCELVNRHQTTDKGFGAALGPAAGAKAARLFSELGYRVHTAPSDWHIGPDARVMQEALLGGWLAAAVATAPEHAVALQDWARRRRAHVGAGRCRLSVGHIDLIGWPAR